MQKLSFGSRGHIPVPLWPATPFGQFWAAKACTKNPLSGQFIPCCVARLFYSWLHWASRKQETSIFNLHTYGAVIRSLFNPRCMCRRARVVVVCFCLVTYSVYMALLQWGFMGLFMFHWKCFVLKFLHDFLTTTASWWALNWLLFNKNSVYRERKLQLTCHWYYKNSHYPGTCDSEQMLLYGFWCNRCLYYRNFNSRYLSTSSFRAVQAYSYTWNVAVVAIQGFSPLPWKSIPVFYLLQLLKSFDYACVNFTAFV